MKKYLYFLALTLISFSGHAQSTPPPVSRGSDNTTQVDRFVTALKRLGIPTADADTLSPGLQLTDAENSAKLLFNTTSQKLRLYVPGTGWRDATPIDLSNYYNKSQVDSLLSELPTGASNLSISSRTDTTVIIGNSNGTGVTLPPVNTSQAGVMPSADKTKLDGIESGAQVNTVTDVAGKTGSVELDKTDVGLDQVDNTSDEDKPVSNVTQDSLNTRERIANKATGFGTLNNTLYPTTQAVNNQITSRLGSYVPLAGNATMTGTLSVATVGLTSYINGPEIRTGNAFVALGGSANPTFSSGGTLRIKNSSSSPLISFHNDTGGRKATIGTTNPAGLSNNLVYGVEGAGYSHRFSTNDVTRLTIADDGVTVTSSIPLINNRAATANGHVVSKGFADTTYVLNSTRGAVNGIATLDGSGKIPLTQIPTSIPYQGTWDASSNTPTLADGAGTAGFYYRVSVSGSQNLGSGTISFSVGDDVIYNGSIWQRAPGGATATNLSLGSVTDTSIVINNSNGTGVTIPAVTESNAGLMTVSYRDKINNAVTEETDPTVDSHIKAITTGNITSWNGKLDSARRVTSFASPNNIDIPTTQAVNNQITSRLGSYVPLAGNATMTGTLSVATVGLTSYINGPEIRTGNAFVALGGSANPTFSSGGTLRIKNSSSSPLISFHSDDGSRKALIGNTSTGNILNYFIEGSGHRHDFYTNGVSRLQISDASVMVPATIPLISNRAATANGHVISKGFADTTYVPKTRTITVNGTPYALSSNISFTTPNTTYTAGTGLTLTGTVFTPTFGTTSGTVAQGNHTHDTATVSVSGFMTPYDKARIASFSTAGLATLGTTQTFTAQKTFNGASANLFMDEGSTGVSPFIYFRNMNNSINGDATSMYYNSGTAGHVMRVNGTGRLTITSSGITVNGGISGGGSGITDLNGSNISSGTVPFARLPVGTSGSTVAVGNHTHDTATVSLPGFMTPYDKSRLAASGNYAVRNATNTFTAANTFTGSLTIPHLTTVSGTPGNFRAINFVNGLTAVEGNGQNALRLYSSSTGEVSIHHGSSIPTYRFAYDRMYFPGTTSQVVRGDGSYALSTTLNVNADNIITGTVDYNRLPVATESTRGAIRIGSGLSIDGAGVVSVTGSGGTTDLKLRTAGSADTGSVRYAGTTATAGQFYGGVTMPSPGERLNFGGAIVAYNLTAANVVQGNQLLGTSLVSKTISTGTPYNIASGTVIAFVNGSTQYASVSSNTTYGVTLDVGQVMDVEITNTSGSAITITFTGATLPAGQNGQIPAGSSAVFSFKRLNPSNSARVTKVIF